MVDYSIISFILRANRRKKVFLCLEKPKIPKEIATECAVSIHNVSKSLKELSDKCLIKCENPKDKFYRFYSLTERGKKLKNRVKEL
jgi:DNA-binding MarR family transcriptional regulator